MAKVEVILGNITFHHFTEEELAKFKTNNEQKALVHSVQERKEFDTLDAAYAFIDESDPESWLIPSEFNGEIVFE